MKLNLTVGPLGQYQFTYEGEPIENLYVINVEPISGIQRVTVETAFIGEVEQPKAGFKAPLEDLLKKS